MVELANPAVARALGRVSGPGSVLDVATLAGPSFVEACLGRRAHEIELDGVEFEVVQFEVDRPTTGTTPSGATSGIWLRSPSCRRTGRRWPSAPDATTARRPETASPSWARQRSCESIGIDDNAATGGPPRRVSLFRRARLQVGIALEEGNKALAVVAGSLLVLLVVATDVLHTTYRPRGRPST